MMKKIPMLLMTGLAESFLLLWIASILHSMSSDVAMIAFGHVLVLWLVSVCYFLNKIMDHLEASAYEELKNTLEEHRRLHGSSHQQPTHPWARDVNVHH
jgi:hypothetical protein